jgi:hypothetical protein
MPLSEEGSRAVSEAQTRRWQKFREKKGTVMPPSEPKPSDTVRNEVKRMSGHATEEEMAAGLPENTMALAEPEMATGKPKRKYAKRGAQAEASADPNLSDPRYVKALADMQAFGGASIVKGGFDVAAIAMHDEKMKLQSDEEGRLDGYFYVMSKKYNVLDPSNHWFTMALYFFGLLGSFIFTRVAHKKGNSMIDQFTRWFGGEKAEKEEIPEGGMT